MAAIDLVSDLIELECLAAVEGDDDRRRRLLELRDRLAARAGGAKLSEAASVLGLSVPTVRSWVASGILELLPDRQPARVTYNSLAFTKRAPGSPAWARARSTVSWTAACGFTRVWRSW